MTRIDDRPVLRLGHSPDPDDAFMWWPLLHLGDGPSRLETGDFRFDAVPADIEVLNARSEAGDLEITAMSCAQYPRVRRDYALTACGASLGQGYGPKLVAGQPATLAALAAEDPLIAVPGLRTSAFGTLSLMLGAATFRHEVVAFDEIIGRVAAGEFDAGLVIHEGQLTFEEAGLHLVEDLGAWWGRRHGLPLPLGVNAIRRDLERRFGEGTLATVTATLRRSVEYALAHRAESIRYALEFARDMGRDLADEFVSMYVNRWTLDFGDDGRQAVRLFLGELHRAGLAPDPGVVDFVAAAAVA